MGGAVKSGSSLLFSLLVFVWVEQLVANPPMGGGGVDGQREGGHDKAAFHTLYPTLPPSVLVCVFKFSRSCLYFSSQQTGHTVPAMLSVCILFKDEHSQLISMIRLPEWNNLSCSSPLRVHRAFSAIMSL